MDGGGSLPGVLGACGASNAAPRQTRLPTGGRFADPSNPIAAWRNEHTATDFTPRVIDLRTGTNSLAVSINERASTSRAAEPASPMEGRGLIRIVPAPGSMALLGLGALAGATRRRR